MVVDPQRQSRSPRHPSGGPDLQGRPGPRRRGAAPESGSPVARLQSFFTRELWARELASLPTFRRWWYGIARVAHLTLVNFVKDRCTWRASALTYITVLSLVPMLALAFSVAKGLGAYDELRTKTIDPFLEETFGSDESADRAIAEAAVEAQLEDGDAGEGLEGASPEVTREAEEALRAIGQLDPDGGEDAESAEGAEPGTQDATDTPPTDDPASGEGGAQVRAAIEMVLGFVDKTNVSQLGALGFLIVIYTVIKLLGSIEVAFNDIWGVRKARSLPRKIADYLSTVVLVPILLVTGTSVLSIARSDRFGGAVGMADSSFFATMSSLVVIWLGFGFAYILMPNTRTRISSALVGGIVGGTMWSLFQAAHVKLQVGVANYNAIYSTFAALPIFLFWVQSSWMTVLLGAEAAAAHQNQARHGQLVRSRDYDIAQKEVVALRLVARLTERFIGGEGPAPLEDLAEELACPERTLEEVARSLEMALITATVGLDEDDPQLILAGNPDRVRIQDVLDALKGPSVVDRLDELMPLEGDDSDRAVARAFQRFRGERDGSPANVTLRELVSGG